MDVVTFGESMILLTPIKKGKLRYSPLFSRQLAGAESNVAIGLARLGKKVGWISKVGDDEFGKYLVSTIRGEGVDTSMVKRSSSSNTGLCIKENYSPNKFNILYYRNNSAASKLTTDDLNENYISQAKVLHLTGITPALSESCNLATNYALKIARRNNMIISFDPNIRLKLWTVETFKPVLKEYISKSDI